MSVETLYLAAATFAASCLIVYQRWNGGAIAESRGYKRCEYENRLIDGFSGLSSETRSDDRN